MAKLERRKTRIGTVWAAPTATRRTPDKPTWEKWEESVSTPAKSSGAKKPTRAVRSTTRSGSSEPMPKEPGTPRTDIGPRAYKEYPSRRRRVVRFFVAGALLRKRGCLSSQPPWFVYDMDSGNIAGRTSKTGYESKKEAVRVAREYRDKYGAYTKAPF